MNTKTLKTIRLNLIIFAILQFFYVISFSVGTSAKPNIFGIFIQYWISSWILRKFIVKSEDDATKVTLSTWCVSIAVFLARIGLGLLWFTVIMG